jgi:hypothetical protein
LKDEKEQRKYSVHPATLQYSPLLTNFSAEVLIEETNYIDCNDDLKNKLGIAHTES